MLSLCVRGHRVWEAGPRKSGIPLLGHHSLLYCYIISVVVARHTLSVSCSPYHMTMQLLFNSNRGFYAMGQFKVMHLASDFTGLETCPFKPSHRAWLGSSFHRGSVGEWVGERQQAGFRLSVLNDSWLLVKNQPSTWIMLSTQPTL